MKINLLSDILNSRSALTVLALIALTVRVAGVQPLFWTRDLLQDTTDPDLRRQPVYVAITASTQGRLSAVCIYQREVMNGTTALHGRIDEDQGFWPLVSYEVRDGPTAGWMRIGRTSESSDTLTSDSRIMELSVDMEPFRRYLGRHRWGRIVLENNRSAIVDLEDLLPPPQRGQQNGNFKYVLDRSGETEESVGFLHSVVSLNGHLTGVFLYTKADPAGAHIIKGSWATDGGFSPCCELYASPNGADWKRIAKAATVCEKASMQLSARPVIFRINMDPYKSAVGRYERGKIVFSDGSFAIFRLCELAMQCSD